MTYFIAFAIFVLGYSLGCAMCLILVLVYTAKKDVDATAEKVKERHQWKPPHG